MAAPTIQATTSSAEVNANNITITKPTGATTGDIWLAIVSWTGSAGSPTLTGFNDMILNAYAESTDGVDYKSITAFERVIDGSEGATASITFSTTPFAAAVSILIRGAANAVHEAGSIHEVSGYSLTRQLTTLTTLGADRLLIGANTQFTTTTLDNTPSGWTAGVTSNLLWTWNKTQAVAGASGTTTFSSGSVFELNASITIAYAFGTGGSVLSSVIGRHTPGTIASQNVRR